MASHDPELKSVFNEALERQPGPERSAYLDDACRGDAALRTQVEELLTALGAAGRFLAPGPGDTTWMRSRTPIRCAASHWPRWTRQSPVSPRPNPM